MNDAILLSIGLILTAVTVLTYAQDSSDYKVPFDDTQLEELRWLQQDDDVEIVSKQKENRSTSAGIVSVYNQQDIERYGGNNLFEILNHITSIYMLGTSVYMQGGISMRGDALGTSNNHVLMLINGRPFRDSGFGGVNESILRNFPIHFIEQLEIIRGPGSVLYGTNAYTGVINIVTKKYANQEHFDLHTRYGSFNSTQIEGEFYWKSSDLSINTALRYANSDGWLFQAQRAGFNPSQFRRSDNSISSAIQLQWKDLTVNGFVIDANYQHWGAAAISSKGEVYHPQRLFIDLGYDFQVNPNWNIQTHLTYNQSTDAQYVPIPPNLSSVFTRLSENNLLFEQTHFIDLFNKKVNIRAGGLVEWQTGRINQQIAGGILPSYTYLKSSLYGEINWTIFDQLKWIIGGQWHHFSHLDEPDAAEYNGFTGRLGLVYEWDKHWGIKLLYSQAYRTPSAFELEINSLPIRGSAELKPEQIETADMQIFYHDSDYQFSLTAFRSRQSRTINVDCQYFPPCQYFNHSAQKYQGLEFESQGQFTKALSWRGSYTFQTNWDQLGNNNTSFIPNHIAKIGLSYAITPEWQFSVFDNFFSQALTKNPKLNFNPPSHSYHQLSLNTRYQLKSLLGLNFLKKFEISLYLDNLFDEKINYPASGRDGFNSMPGLPGRSLYGELSLKF
ncbi:MAG: hypothetical protein RL637_1100 [Pseudomonadota bacterium]|jgi:outer membrane cobalamin receptor